MQQWQEWFINGSEEPRVAGLEFAVVPRAQSTSYLRGMRVPVG